MNEFTPKHKERLVGIEFEFVSTESFRKISQKIENAGEKVQYSFGVGDSESWNIKYDSSITHESGMHGVEIATPATKVKEIKGKFLPVWEIMKLSGYFTNESCGGHIHIDAHDMNKKSLLNLIENYRNLQDELYGLSGNRMNNRYCEKIEPENFLEITAIMKNVISKFNISLMDMLNLLEADGQIYKYKGMNLTSILKRGTIEFRMHEGFKDLKQARGWADLLAALVEGSISGYTFNSVNELAVYAARGDNNRPFRQGTDVWKVYNYYMESGEKWMSFEEVAEATNVPLLHVKYYLRKRTAKGAGVLSEDKKSFRVRGLGVNFLRRTKRERGINLAAA